MRNWFHYSSAELVGGNQNRIFGLDLFRSIAIISVMLGHSNFVLGGGEWLPQTLHVAGVEWFFVISGFLIGQIILRDFDKGLSFRSLWFFWRRRWFRTLPNYYLVLILTLVLAYFGLISTSFENFNWKFIFFLQNFDRPFFDFFWESWSLSIEEWFYIFFPLLAFLALQLKFLSKSNALLISILLLILAPLIIKMIQPPPANLNAFDFDNTYRKLVIYRLDSIIYGVLMAFLKLKFPQIWYKARWALLIIAVVVLQVFSFTELDLGSRFAQIFYYPLHSFTLALMIPFFDSWQKAPSWLSKPIIWVSKISYSLYLVHLGIILGLMTTFFKEYFEEWSLLMHSIFWLSSILLSSLIYLYFENPITRLRPKYQNRVS